MTLIARWGRILESDRLGIGRRVGARQPTRFQDRIDERDQPLQEI
ncbi:hypothetical protein SAMN07250955_11216 [Arboricoccus pini]|uniref:Uncharacterized protein n=1 Tax=Arboricoccus pini TaxID=1963835 RepID=A0A212RPY0_9PROT|nr:hypothetical protein [Arboricoccus pini]SNB74607.1 hypothetical protein SAMN07250955_11216 [Arboricoccus pini]